MQRFTDIETRLNFTDLIRNDFPGDYSFVLIICQRKTMQNQSAGYSPDFSGKNLIQREKDELDTLFSMYVTVLMSSFFR